MVVGIGLRVKEVQVLNICSDIRNIRVIEQGCEGCCPNEERGSRNKTHH